MGSVRVGLLLCLLGLVCGFWRAFVVEDCGVLAWEIVPDVSYAVDVCPLAREDRINVEGDRVLLIID